MHGRGQGDGLGGGREVDEDDDFFAVAFAGVDVDAWGDGAEGGFDAADVGHPFGGGDGGGVGRTAFRVGVEPGGDVGDAAFADLAGDGGGLAVEPAVAFSVAHEDFGVGGGGGELLGPDGRGGGAPLPGDGDGGVDGVELLDAAAEEFGERARAALGLEAVVGVLHGGALAEDEMAAIADVVHEIAGGVVGEDGEAGGDDELVGAERGGGLNDVDGLADLAEGAVVADDLLDGVEVVVVTLPVDGPAAVVGVEDGDLGVGEVPARAGPALANSWPSWATSE